MHLTVTHNNRLDSARWEIALDLLAVLALDTRCLHTFPDGHPPFHESPDHFFTRGLKWNPHHDTYILDPYYQFRLQFNVSGWITGWIDCTHAQDLSTVKAGITAALTTPYTIANRRSWKLDEQRKYANAHGDDEQATRLLEEQRRQSLIANSFYDRFDQERMRMRQSRAHTDPQGMSPDQEWQWIFTQLTHAGRAIRTGQALPLAQSTR